MLTRNHHQLRDSLKQELLVNSFDSKVLFLDLGFQFYGFFLVVVVVGRVSCKRIFRVFEFGKIISGC